MPVVVITERENDKATATIETECCPSCKTRLSHTQQKLNGEELGSAKLHLLVAYAKNIKPGCDPECPTLSTFQKIAKEQGW